MEEACLFSEMKAPLASIGFLGGKSRTLFLWRVFFFFFSFILLFLLLQVNGKYDVKKGRKKTEAI